LKPRQVLPGIGPQFFLLLGLKKEQRDLLGQRFQVIIRKGQAAGTNCFRQTASIGPNDYASAGNPFQSHHPKWFIISRRNNQNFVLPQLIDQGGSLQRSRECYLPFQL
jgi:hypothetical protein